MTFKLLYILRWPFALVFLIVGIPVAVLTAAMQKTLQPLKELAVGSFVYLFSWGRGL